MMRKSKPMQWLDGDVPVILPARFWSKVVREGECWIWRGANTGAKNPHGVAWDGSRLVKAHRMVLEAVGRLVSDGVADHLCRRPLCVRPSHLEVVTQRINVLRGDAPGALAIRTNACKRGHEFTPENTYARGPRHRECRTCKRANRSKYARSVA